MPTGGSSASGATTVTGWRENILVLSIVLAPIALASILMATGLSALAAWQIAHGIVVSLPSPASLRPYGLLSYALACWIAVIAAWLWSSRRGIAKDILVFRKLSWPALAACLAGFILAMYGVPVVTRWLSHATGRSSHGIQLDFNDPTSVAVFIFLFVVTAPVCEEILYRGLLVYWLRRAGWRNAAILLAGSLLFGANHLLPLGFVWSIAMVGFGAILFGLRLRYESLSPGWLTHILFNAQPLLTYPLLALTIPSALPVLV